MTRRLQFVFGALALSVGVARSLPAAVPGPRCSALDAAKPEPHRFALVPAGRTALASGLVNMIPAWSPFGLSVNNDGSFVYDLTITVKGLPDPATLGPYKTYVAWAATPSLDRIQNLGPVVNGKPIQLPLDWNKIMILVSAEPVAATPKWTGAVVLTGRSPSALLQSFAGHELFNTGNPVC